MENINTTIQEIYNRAIKIVDERIAWYQRKSAVNGKLSKSFRLITIIFGGIGILCPLFDSLSLLGVTDGTFSKLGYIFFGLAGIFLILDRFYGWSTGWMRFMSTLLRLEKLKRQFELKWLNETFIKTQENSTARNEELAQIILTFINDVDNEVERETDIWVQEFQTSLAALEQFVNNK